MEGKSQFPVFSPWVSSGQWESEQGFTISASTLQQGRLPAELRPVGWLKSDSDIPILSLAYPNPLPNATLGKGLVHSACCTY